MPSVRLFNAVFENVDEYSFSAHTCHLLLYVRTFRAALSQIQPVERTTTATSATEQAHVG